MRVLISLGPTYESLDDVRRLTNFSTGTLGTELANYFSGHGHNVTALRGYYSTCRTPLNAAETIEFTTTENLLNIFRECSAQSYDALFHAAAVSDFKFGQVFEKCSDGALRPLAGDKFSTRSGPLLAELVPTPKIIAQLRDLFPRARLFGWKYELDGGHEAALAAGTRQLHDNHTDFSVINGRAYGEGFGILSKTGTLDHVPDAQTLCRTLLRLTAQ